MLFKLAWRNIWRNKRRTLITAASIMFAVFFASFMQSLQNGIWDNMLGNVVNFYYGYAQIHQNGYQDEQSIDKAFAIQGNLSELAQDVPEIKAVVPRIESFALASKETATAGVLVVGIEADAENELTHLADRIVEGAYLVGNEKAALIGKGIAEKLNLGINDTLILVSQGYRGVNAAGKFPVKGILSFGSPALNKRMVYLPLEEAQYFYGAENLVTSLALKIDDRNEVPLAIKAVESKLDMTEYEVLDWQKMLPELMEAKALDTASNRLVLAVLYLIITFGIFGTILMMTKERSYEFGVLTAIGMKRWKLSVTVWLEIIMMGFVGVLAGILISIPIVYYFQMNPIDLTVLGKDAGKAYEKFGMEPILPAAFKVRIFINQAIIVFFITTILAIYPWTKINKLQPVEAMRE